VATIKKDPKTGLYYVRYDAGFDGEGGRTQKYKSGFKLKSDAEDFLAKQRTDINQGTYIEPEKMFLFEYLNQWLADKKNSISPTTYNGYEINIRCHISPYIGGIRLQELRAAHIRSLYSKLQGHRKIKIRDVKRNFKPLSGTSIQYVHRVLSKALEDAYMEETIHKNPAKLVTPPPKNRFEAGFLTANQIKGMLEKFKDDALYIVVFLSVVLGLRRGEVLGLQWGNIDMEQKIIYIRKNYIMNSGKPELTDKPKTDSSIRDIVITDRIVKELKAHKVRQIERKLQLGAQYHKSDFVCAWPDGRPFNPSHISRAFTNRMKKYSLPDVRFHDLRHSNAALMISQNAPMKGASDRLGHSTIQITNDLYGHVERSVQEQIANMIDVALWGD
jgi:integrase